MKINVHRNQLKNTGNALEKASKKVVAIKTEFAASAHSLLTLNSQSDIADYVAVCKKLERHIQELAEAIERKGEGFNIYSAHYWNAQLRCWKIAIEARRKV